MSVTRACPAYGKVWDAQTQRVTGGQVHIDHLWEVAVNQAGDGGSSEPAVAVELCEVDSEYILKVDEGRVLCCCFSVFCFGGNGWMSEIWF